MKTAQGQEFIIGKTRELQKVYSRILASDNDYVKSISEEAEARYWKVFDERRSGKTLKQIGKMFGVSKQRIRQILAMEFAKFGIFALDKEGKNTRIYGFRTQEQAEAFSNEWLIPKET